MLTSWYECVNFSFMVLFGWTFSLLTEWGCVSVSSLESVSDRTSLAKCVNAPKTHFRPNHWDLNTETTFGGGLRRMWPHYFSLCERKRVLGHLDGPPTQLTSFDLPKVFLHLPVFQIHWIICDHCHNINTDHHIWNFFFQMSHRHESNLVDFFVNRNAVCDYLHIEQGSEI